MMRKNRGGTMPNWIEGTLKLRGSKEKLKKFFDNAIKPWNH